MSKNDWLIAAVFAAWFIATAIRQVGAVFPVRAQFLNEWFRKRDLLSVVPVWAFFAPYPAMNDYHLLFRDKLATGTLTPWTEVRLTPERRWFHVLWNPGKREKKALYDAVSLIRRDLLALTESGHGKESIVLSFGYLVILSYVSHLQRTFPSSAVQFALMASNGVQPPLEPVLIFRSEFHRR